MIYIDGDSSNIIECAESIAARYKVPCHIYCDTKHHIVSDYSQVHIVDCGPDSVDFAIIGACGKNDIVITNDMGLAGLALTRQSIVINTKGLIINDDNINYYLHSRYMRKCAVRKAKRDKVKCSPNKLYVESSGDFNHTLTNILKGLNK